VKVEVCAVYYFCPHVIPCVVISPVLPSSQIRQLSLMTFHKTSKRMMALMACSLIILLAFYSKIALNPDDIRTLGTDEKTTTAAKIADKIIMFLSIMTGPDNIDRRNALRTTWLSTLPDDWTYEFLSDGPTKEPDVVSFDINDGKINNTHNHREAVTSYSRLNQLHIQHALKRHPNLKYYMRIDDDTFFVMRI